MSRLHQYIGRAVASMLAPYLRLLEKQIMATQADVDALTTRVQALETKVDAFTPTGGTTPAGADLDLSALTKAVDGLEGSVNAKLV